MRRVSSLSPSPFFHLIEIAVNLVNGRIHAADVLTQLAGCRRASMGQPMNVSSFALQVSDASRKRSVLIGASIVGVELALQSSRGFLKTVGQSNDVVL
jgi:hypothetical protein